MGGGFLTPVSPLGYAPAWVQYQWLRDTGAYVGLLFHPVSFCAISTCRLISMLVPMSIRHLLVTVNSLIHPITAMRWVDPGFHTRRQPGYELIKARQFFQPAP